MSNQDMQKLREKRREAGLVRVDLWVHRDHQELIKAIAKLLQKSRD